MRQAGHKPGQRKGGGLVIKLKEVREAKKMSQEKLSELSGISRQRIYKIETDPRANVTVATLQKLAEALGVDIDDIFFAKSVNQD